MFQHNVHLKQCDYPCSLVVSCGGPGIRRATSYHALVFWRPRYFGFLAYQSPYVITAKKRYLTLRVKRHTLTIERVRSVRSL